MAEAAAVFNERLLEMVSERVGLIRSLTFPTRGADEPNPPVICQAMLSHFDFRKADAARRITAGKGRTEEEAMSGAIGEAMERYCGSQIDPGSVRRAAFNSLGVDAMAPTEFVLYSEAQYAKKYFPYRPWLPESETGWVTGQSLADGAAILVPAALVYMIRPQGQREDFVDIANSNGLAAGPDLESATLGGLYELIERDAFLIYWMNRLPAPELEYDSNGGLADSIRAHYARFGVELRVFDISTDLRAYVMMAVACDRTLEGGPAALVGLGCHLDPGIALLKASMEICQVRPGHVRRYREDSPAGRLKEYSDVRVMEDHSDFAALPENRHEFDFLLQSGRREKLAELPQRGTGSVGTDLARCVTALQEAGCRSIAIDLTTEDVSDYGVRVVRTLAAGLQPMHFGHGKERLGGRRLFEVPCRIGLASRPLAEGELNPCPHPLA